MKSKLTRMLHRAQRSMAGMGSLAAAIATVALVLGIALASMAAPSVEERLTELARADAPAPPVKAVPVRNLELYVTGRGLGRPILYVADLEVHGWKDKTGRIVDASIGTAHPIEGDPAAVTRDGEASVAHEYSQRISGQRVQASVDSAAVDRLKVGDRARVRLVLMPRGEAASLIIDDVLGPAEDPVPVLRTRAVAAAAATDGEPASRSVAIASTSARVISLSTYHAAPGTEVIMSGTGFGAPRADQWVICGGVRATATAWGDTSIRFIVPAGMTQPGYVGVVMGDDISNGIYFSPFNAPTLQSITPRDAVVGSVMTLTGKYFGSSQGRGWVTVAGMSAEVISWSDTQIQVVVPRDGTTGYVGVVNNGLTSNGILYGPHGLPVVEAVSRRLALVNDTVTITGRGFGSRGRVILGGVQITPTSWSPTSVTFTVPTTAKAGYLGIVRGDGSTSNGLWLNTAPRVASLSKWWAGPGEELRISGLGFGASQGSMRAFVGGVEAEVVSWSDSAVRVRVPAEARTGYVGVGTRSACSNGRYLVVERQARISSVSDTNVGAGDVIVINGSDFGEPSSNSRLTLGGAASCEVESWSDTRIIATVGAGASSGYLGVVKSGISSNGVWLNVAR